MLQRFLKIRVPEIFICMFQCLIVKLIEVILLIYVYFPFFLKNVFTISHRLEHLYAFHKRNSSTLVGLLQLKIIISLLIMPRKVRRWPLRYEIEFCSLL